jgi:phosphate transport system substrate-binding protein
LTSAPPTPRSAAPRRPAAAVASRFPWALAATGFSYNLSGVGHLTLSGQAIAEIYLGQITTWNAAAIAALNKGETLPSEKITPVWRSDSSGDTYVFTTFLSRASPAWASKVGAGTSPSVSVPVGTGAKGNGGVAQVVASTPGAIGNNSWFYIRQAALKAVAVENAAGTFAHPYEPYLADAADLPKTVPSLNTLSSSTATTIANDLSLVDPAYSKPKKGAKPSQVQKEEAAAYPLATFTYVIVRRRRQPLDAPAVHHVRDQPGRAGQGHRREAAVRAAAEVDRDR